VREVLREEHAGVGAVVRVGAAAHDLIG
jgi:hypothetical protein